MRLLFDTHALIWWQTGSERLPRKARQALEDRDNEVFFSAANAFEIAVKWRLGKLSVADALIHAFRATLFEQGFQELVITSEHALAAGRLAMVHGDPFDRLLIAQALSEQLTLVSNAELFDRAAVSRLWG